MSVTQNAPTRLLLADHLLRDVVGHHLGYNLALVDGAARAGIEPCLVTHRGFDASLANGVPCRKIFRTDYRADPPAWIARNHRLLRLLESWCDRQFGSDLKRFSEVGAGDAVFAQMIAPRHFLQWLRWMADLSATPVLFLHLGYRPERFESEEIPKAFKSLPARIRRRVVLVTDSEKLVGAFERNLGSRVYYLPHILSYPLPKQCLRQPDRPVRIYAPGNARREKGFAEVVAAIRQIRESARSGDFHFSIHCHHPDPACTEMIRGGLPQGDNIEWIDRPLGDADYMVQLLESDVVLLPYHLDLYAMRTSGIFCEARVAGKPVIASRGSWAGDRVAREGGGWLVEERDAKDLVRTILKTPPEIPAMTGESRSLALSAGAEFHRDGFMAEFVKIYSSVIHDCA